MAINIESFKSKFKDGGARPNLFKIDAFGRFGAKEAEKLQFTCKAASIPPSDLGIIQVPYQGRRIPIAGDRTYPEWTLTVMNDEAFTVRRRFEDWSSKINHPEQNVRNSGYYNLDDYKWDLKVIHLDKMGDQIAVYNLVGAFPSNVGPIELAWDNNDTIEEYTITLQYDYWVPLAEGAGLETGSIAKL